MIRQGSALYRNIVLSTEKVSQIFRAKGKTKKCQHWPSHRLDDERCVLCSRCVRFSKEIVDDDVLGFVDRGSHNVLTVHPDKPLANNYSLNTVDICPVGALTNDLDFR